VRSASARGEGPDPPVSVPSADPRFVAVRVAGVRYAFPIGSVVEVHQAAAVTPAPEGRGGIVGWLDLRGAVTPVVDARAALGQAPTPWDSTRRFVVVVHDGRFAAVVVDDVEDVMEATFEASRADAAPGIAGVARSADGLVPVLDPAALVPSAREVPS
jgi:purine-binding chemotaxis protein CheW